MLRWLALAGLLLLVVPAAQACKADATPSLQLSFPRPEGCSRLAPKECPPLPDVDAPYVTDGILTWSWALDSCSTTAPSLAPVHIHLEAILRETAGWLKLETDPREVTITPAQQWDLTDDLVDPVTGTHEARESYPVRVTVSVVGEPSQRAMAVLEGRGGAVPLDLRARQEASDTFGGAFTLRSFVFDGSAHAERPAAEAPAPGFLAPAAALAFAGLRRRA